MIFFISLELKTICLSNVLQGTNSPNYVLNSILYRIKETEKMCNYKALKIKFKARILSLDTYSSYKN